jgi:hypothetical protein
MLFYPSIGSNCQGCVQTVALALGTVHTNMRTLLLLKYSTQDTRKTETT